MSLDIFQNIKDSLNKSCLFRKVLKYKHFPIITVSLALVLLFVVSFSYGSRPPRKRNLTTTPLLWAKLDGTLTDENSSGSTFAYSPGKPATESGISIKEGDNIQYSPGSSVSAGSGIYENWNPNQGTMNVWVQPNWAGNDNMRHDIWNADYGRIDTADANLKAYFKFDEGSEDFAFDSSANSNIGYLHGPALSFDGTADYVNCGAGDSLNITDVISVEAWIKGNVQSDGYILNKYDHGLNKRTWAMSTDPAATSKLRVILSDNGTTIKKDYTSNVTVLDGSWKHVAFSFNGTAVLVYINGVEDSAIVKTTDLAISGLYSSTVNTMIGSRLNSGTPINYFSGQINNVRIYNRALSPTEVAQHYAGDFSGGNSGLVGYWPMNENQGQTVYDKSGSNNNGTRGADANSGADDPTWVNYAPGWTEEGRFGKGVVFDGTDDEVEINDINF